MLENIKNKYKFFCKIKVFRISLNRSKIYLQFSKLKYSIKRIRDFKYILLSTIQKLEDILKIIIYIDKIN